MNKRLALKSHSQLSRAISPSNLSSKKPQMKTIGIIGGISWVSSIEYYRLMNEMVRRHAWRIEFRQDINVFHSIWGFFQR